MSKHNAYFVYYLRSFKDNGFYIGVSDDVNRRFEEHNNGQSKSTASRRPWALVRVEKYGTIEEAYKRERWLKKQKSRKLINKIVNCSSEG